MVRYPEEIKKYIFENYKGINPKGMAEKVNLKFNKKYTDKQLTSFYKNNKLKSGLNKGFPEEVKAFIRANYKGIGHKKLAELIKTEFSLIYKPLQIKNFCKNHNLKSGLKSGYNPQNVILPIGSESTYGDYVRIKVSNVPFGGKKNWKQKHIVIWEAAYGPVPKNHAVIFADRNRRNFELDNLILVTQKELFALNRNKLITEDKELTKAGLLVSRLNQKIIERRDNDGRS